MTNYKEILRLSGLGLAKQDIAASCQCSRNTVRNVLNAAQEHGITWATARESSNEALRDVLFPGAANKPLYRMPDYEYIHQEMQKSGVTLSLLWVEYCEQCRANGDLPYQSTQFNKYYADFVHKTNATMHLEHKPGDTMQVDWAGHTAAIIDTDTATIHRCGKRMEEMEAQQKDLQAAENRFNEVKAWLDAFRQCVTNDAISTNDTVLMKALVERIIVWDDHIEVVFKCEGSIEQKYVA